MAGQIGDHMVRNRGTIGGSVANNDPSACYPSAVLALDATIKTNKREINSDDFFVGPNKKIIRIDFPLVCFNSCI